MKQTRLLMGMPITLEIVDATASEAAFDTIFAYLTYVDETFSTYKPRSEISRLNARELALAQASADMRAIFALAERTRRETDGYFDIQRDGFYDPSGVVKGWAIANAAAMLRRQGFANFYVEAGGDIQAVGCNAHGRPWRVGIRNPFNAAEIVKVLEISNGGVATSGTYVRGQHIYNPMQPHAPLRDVASLTVVGPDICDADRFATGAFAMGRDGILFIERLAGYEGYMIDAHGLATYTSGFARYIAHADTY
jgi:thiamine biosynthesis lipoprotein